MDQISRYREAKDLLLSVLLHSRFTKMRVYKEKTVSLTLFDSVLPEGSLREKELTSHNIIEGSPIVLFNSIYNNFYQW